jgi:hypothetical protein
MTGRDGQTASGSLETLRRPLECRQVGLRVEPYRIEAAVPQQSGRSRQVHDLARRLVEVVDC